MELFELSAAINREHIVSFSRSRFDGSDFTSYSTTRRARRVLTPNKCLTYPGPVSGSSPDVNWCGRSEATESSVGSRAYV